MFIETKDEDNNIVYLFLMMLLIRIKYVYYTVVMVPHTRAGE